MIVIISVRVGTEGFNLPVGEGSSLHLYWCWRKGCSSFEWSSVVRFSLFPRTKLYKFKTNQIGYFSFLIAGLPPTEGSARRAKGVKLISKGIGLIIHWALKSKKVLRALAKSSIGFNSPSYFPRASPICPVFIISFSHFLIFFLYKYTFG